MERSAQQARVRLTSQQVNMYHRRVPGRQRPRLILLAALWVGLLAVGWVVRLTGEAPGAQSASQSASQPASTSADQSADQPPDHPANEPADQSANQPADQPDRATGRVLVKIPLTTRRGRVAGRTQRVGYLEFNREAGGTPVLMLHGSPGAGDNFSDLAKQFAGRRIIAPDLPGFGSSSAWLPDYSMLSHARAMLLLLEEVGIERAHVVGWSNGGGIALFMADLEPERFASLTLLASIGVQETEGSGSYWFEHAKYGVGLVALVGAAELVPGLNATPAGLRHAFLRTFWDSDQRPLRAIMSGLAIPTLIYHGQHDFLTPAWGARLHHEIMPASRLIMTPHSHFMPFAQAQETAADLAAFFAAVEDGSFKPGIEDRTARVERGWLGSSLESLNLWARGLHWTVQLLLIAGLAVLARYWAITIAAVFVALMAVDFGVATAALWLGCLIRPKGDGILRTIVVRLLELTFAWAALRIVVQVLWTPGHEVAAIAAALAIGFLIWFLPRSMPRPTRQRALGRLSTWWRHEFWPPWIFYLPLGPWLVALAARHRHPLAFTCANPGITPGGGVVGESKKQIIDALGPRDEILPAELLDAGGSERVEQAARLIDEAAELNGYPIILKPDRGEKGYAVRLARTPAQVAAYLEHVRLPVLVQKYHAGPHECGVLWVRSSTPDNGRSGAVGRILAITHKQRPVVEGDGRRTLRELILAHWRFRAQTDLLFARHAERLDMVPAQGERIVLAEAGNHAQGAIFRDGEHLRSPELERTIESLVLGFAGELDFVRFDIRYDDPERLREGVGMGIVEMNGVLSESTNLYDPDRSLLWAYRVLFRQWSELYRVGGDRMRAGARPMPVLAFVRLVREHRRERRRAIVSD